MANAFQKQSLIEKAVAFKWMAAQGFADRLQFRNDLVPGAQKNAGYTTTVRRPSRLQATMGATGVDYNLPGVTSPAVGYSNLNDAVVPVTVEKRFEVNIQASMEELTFELDRDDVVNRFIEPAIVSMRDQINLYISNKIEAFAGNTIITTASTGDNIIKSLFDAKALMSQRGALTNGTKKSVLFNPNIMPTLGVANAKVFNAPDGAGLWSNAEYAPLAGFDVYESPLLSVPTITSGSYTVAGSQGARPTSWTQTWNLTLAGLTSGATIKAGTKIKFTNAGTTIKWANPTIGTDIGYDATFTVAVDKVATGTTDTLVVTEPFIPTGDSKNVTADLIPGTTVVTVVNPGTTRPSYAFANDSIILVSPEVKLPSGLDYSKSMKLGGFNIALIEDHYPGTLQTITKLVCFAGASVVKPEGIVALY